MVMTGRQRRAGGSALAGTGLATTGWWAQWSGYEVVGLALTLLAGIVVLGGAWRSGALHLPQAAEPAPDIATPPLSSARAKADQERSMRLLKAIDEAADDGLGQGGELSEFERIVLYGVAELPGREYPPAGHGYPAREHPGSSRQSRARVLSLSESRSTWPRPSRPTTSRSRYCMRAWAPVWQAAAPRPDMESWAPSPWPCGPYGRFHAAVRRPGLRLRWGPVGGVRGLPRASHRARGLQPRATTPSCRMSAPLTAGR